MKKNYDYYGEIIENKGHKYLDIYGSSKPLAIMDGEVGTIIRANHKGGILEVLGYKDEPGMQPLITILKKNVHNQFSDEAIREAIKKPTSVSETEVMERQDFRHKEMITIDKEDTNCHEDGLTIEKLANNHYLLGIHVVDTSHYIKEGSAIDRDAKERTNKTIYSRLIPTNLANGICSFNHNADRLAISVMIEIDQRGNVLKTDFVSSVVNNKHKLTYKMVDQLLKSDQASYLKDLKIVADAVKQKRLNKYSDQIVKECNSSSLVEELILLADQQVALRINDLFSPFIKKGRTDNEAKQLRKTMVLLTAANNSTKENHNEVISLLSKTMKQVANDTLHFTRPDCRHDDLVLARVIKRFLINDLNRVKLNELGKKVATLNHLIDNQYDDDYQSRICYNGCVLGFKFGEKVKMYILVDETPGVVYFESSEITRTMHGLVYNNENYDPGDSINVHYKEKQEGWTVFDAPCRLKVKRMCLNGNN